MKAKKLIEKLVGKASINLMAVESATKSVINSANKILGDAEELLSIIQANFNDNPGYTPGMEQTKLVGDLNKQMAVLQKELRSVKGDISNTTPRG